MSDNVEAKVADFNLSLKDSTIVLIAVAVVALFSNWAGTGNHPFESMPGMLIICGMIYVGMLLKTFVPIGFPAVAWVSLVSVIITMPFSPVAEVILSEVSKINFLSIATPVLAYAALSITKLEVDLFKKSGIKIAIISILVFTGTYVGSAMVADYILKVSG